MITVTVKKYKGPNWSATFVGDRNGDTGPFPTVTLARTPFAKGKDTNGDARCSFQLDDLQSHDGHRPSFSSEAKLDIYIERVRQDVAAAIATYRNEPVESVLARG